VKLSTHCLSIKSILGGPFFIDAVQTALDFSKFPDFEPTDCHNKNVLSWEPRLANCDSRCGLIRCDCKSKKQAGLCVDSSVQKKNN
jgi:hypothetical protein